MAAALLAEAGAKRAAVIFLGERTTNAAVAAGLREEGKRGG